MSIPVSKKYKIVFPNLLTDDYKTRVKALSYIEKLTRRKPQLLEEKKNIILDIMSRETLEDVQGFVARVLPRLSLKKIEIEKVKNILDRYLRSNNTDVQISTLQAIGDLARQGKINKRGAIWTIYFFIGHSSNNKIITRGKKLLKTLDI